MTGALGDAIAFATAHESPWPRDPGAPPPPGGKPWGVHHDDPPPYNRLRGPVHARGPQSGVVVRHGEEIAAWGEPDRADLTFSVAKSYLALLAGIAHDDGLLLDEDERVGDRIRGIGFDDSEHNRAITWGQLLTQTSEWQGTSSFGIPDTVAISARDQARIGGMVLAGGTVRGRTIVSREWLERMATRCPIAPWYGRLVWLNRDGKQFPGASTRAIVMQGAGDHTTWIDPELDAVVVLRWVDPAQTRETFARFGAALRR